VLLTAVTVFVPVTRSKAIGSAPMLSAGGGGQSWLVGKSDRVPTTESAGVHGFPSPGFPVPLWQTLGPPQVPPPGQSALVLHGPPVLVPPVQVWLQTGQTWMPGAAG
jgi:hypothetical protein